MTSHRTIADAYHRALAHGLVTPSEVITWVDAVIATEDKPAIAFIDATCAGDDAAAILTALGQVPGNGDRVQSNRLVLGLMKQLVACEPGEYARVAKTLYAMAIDGDAPSAKAEGDMWSFYDDLNLAVDGVHGNEKHICRDILAFLTEHGEVI